MNKRQFKHPFGKLLAPNQYLCQPLFAIIGYTHQEIADKTGKSLQNVIQIAKRVTTFRCESFQSPFIEYIAVRTAKAIRKSIGVHALSDPDKLSDFESVRALILWSGVSDGVMKDLAAGLVEAGYESFDVEEIKGAVFTTKRKA